MSFSPFSVFNLSVASSVSQIILKLFLQGIDHHESLALILHVSTCTERPSSKFSTRALNMDTDL